MVPHALLDIVRGCNIRCDVCYNRGKPGKKSLAEISQDLDTLQAHRKVQSVSIVGGEPTLHPDLCEIVRHVRQRGLHAEMLTNGLDLDDTLLRMLKDAGLELIFLHIDAHQHRPDLPTMPTEEDVRHLQKTLGARVTEHGMEAGLAITLYEENPTALCDTVNLVLDSPNLTYLLFTLNRKHANIRAIQGDLNGGMRGELVDPSSTTQLGNLDLNRLRQILAERLDLHPFAFLGSNANKDVPRWLSYYVATASNGHEMLRQPLRATVCEKLFVQVARFIGGRYPMYVPQNPTRVRGQLRANAFSGGDWHGNLRFLRETGIRPETTRAKRIIFQNPATVEADGRVIHCSNCPDAVAIGDKLAPACLADLIS